MGRADLEDSAIGLLLRLPCQSPHGPAPPTPTAEYQAFAASQRFGRYQTGDGVETERPVEALGKRMPELEEENRELRHLTEA